MRAAIVTISDRSFRGERADVSGPVLKTLLEAAGAVVVETVVVPDERTQITATLCRLADETACELIFTTGGTGLSPRDVTPEATRAVVTREVPGIEQAIYQASLTQTPYAMLSRGVAGVRGHTLILNFPGSPKAVKECFAVVESVLAHAVKLLRDDDPYTEPDHLPAPRQAGDESARQAGTCHPSRSLS